MQVKLTIGEHLKDLRTAQKLTLEQLAAEVASQNPHSANMNRITARTSARIAFWCWRTITVFPATI